MSMQIILHGLHFHLSLIITLQSAAQLVPHSVTNQFLYFVSSPLNKKRAQARWRKNISIGLCPTPITCRNFLSINTNVEIGTVYYFPTSLLTVVYVFRGQLTNYQQLCPCIAIKNHINILISIYILYIICILIT